MKNILNRITWIFGSRVRHAIVYSYLYLMNFSGREHYKCYGALNPDKTVYYIRNRYGDKNGEGLLSVLSYVMERIEYAESKGYIPFVDYMAVSGGDNLQSYFCFKNVLSKEEVLKSKNVLYTGWNSKKVPCGWCLYMSTDHNVEKKKLLDKYVEVTEMVKVLLKSEEEKIVPKDCLGLYLRGTDYIRLKPQGHPVQPTLDDVREQINGILRNQGLKKIFLVTEDMQIYEQIKNEYPGMIITVSNDKFWEQSDDGAFIAETIYKKGEVKENNLRYLVKILLLARCRAIVSGKTNGSMVAMAFNGGEYQREFVFDRGLY